MLESHIPGSKSGAGIPIAIGPGMATFKSQYEKNIIEGKFDALL